MSFVAPFGDGITDIVVTGCGSTHYLALSAAALLRETGLRAWALPASELIAQAQPRYASPGETLLLAISRSGTTTETVMAVEHFRRIGGRSVAVVTSYPDSTLASAADVVWAAPASAERSVAQTRSFTSMQVIVSAMAGALSGVGPGGAPGPSVRCRHHSHPVPPADGFARSRAGCRLVLLPRVGRALRDRCQRAC